MVLVGAVLLVLCAVLGAGIALSNTEPSAAEAFGVTLTNVSVGGLFLVGVVVGALAMLGVGLMLAGAARKRAKKTALKREVRSARGQQETLAEENARLQAELQQSRTAGLPDAGTVDDGSGRGPRR